MEVKKISGSCLANWRQLFFQAPKFLCTRGECSQLQDMECFCWSFWILWSAQILFSICSYFCSPSRGCLFIIHQSSFSVINVYCEARWGHIYQWFCYAELRLYTWYVCVIYLFWELLYTWRKWQLICLWHVWLWINSGEIWGLSLQGVYSWTWAIFWVQCEAKDYIQ